MTYRFLYRVTYPKTTTKEIVNLILDGDEIKVVGYYINRDDASVELK
jgi:hypothetical protein